MRSVAGNSTFDYGFYFSDSVLNIDWSNGERILVHEDFRNTVQVHNHQNVVTDSLVHSAQDSIVTYKGISKRVNFPDLSNHFSVICTPHFMDGDGEIYFSVLVLKKVSSSDELNLRVSILSYGAASDFTVTAHYRDFISADVSSFHSNLNARIIVNPLTINIDRAAVLSVFSSVPTMVSAFYHYATI